MADSIIERIESFACRRGRLLAERRNRGYTLYQAVSGAPVARLRQTGKDDRVEVLYWSLWKERWTSVGRSGEPSYRLMTRSDSLRQRTSSGAIR